MLTSYNGQAITYDEIGNPLNDGTWAYTWQHGRQLASMNSEKTTLEFEYNADGIRTKKIVTTTSDHVHTFQDAVTQPKCTENGYTTHTCICGYIYQDSPVPATGHDFTTTVVGTNCTEVGHTVYTCACGYSYEDGSNGHTFSTLVVEPSETINGFTLHECECGYSYQSDPVASLAGASNTVDVISDTKVYDYVYNGSTLTQLTITTTITGDGTTTEVLYFTYDGSSPMAVTYGDNIYYYVTNLQGDVIAILDASGNAVVEYVYDAWGNILNAEEVMATDLGAVNPLTYRSYVYDAESKLYYLQSRYYDPELGRFINADALVSTGQGLLGNNMFAYCNNNPANLKDSSGKIPDSYAGQFGELLGEFLYELFTGDDHPSHETEEIERNVIQKQVDIISSIIESDEFQSVANSDEVKGMKGLNKIRSGWSSIKKGAGMILVPIPTEAEDIAGVALITYGIIKSVGGIVECVVAVIGG